MLIQSHKVRLLLNPDGSLQITSEPIPSPTADPLRVQISVHPTDSSNPMYFHKTTYRPVYAEALKAAQALGYDEVLFLNQRGEVTEATIHNLFIQKNGRLITPPIGCGLLTLRLLLHLAGHLASLLTGQNITPLPQGHGEDRLGFE